MKKILLIDVDLEFSQAVCTALRRHGYEIYHATNGLPGLSLYRQHRFDLVMSDILMPDSDGVEVILAIRKMDATIPIIAISGGGLVTAETCERIAKACGGNAFLNKPFDISCLLVKINSMIGD